MCTENHLVRSQAQTFFDAFCMNHINFYTKNYERERKKKVTLALFRSINFI